MNILIPLVILSCIIGVCCILFVDKYLFNSKKRSLIKLITIGFGVIFLILLYLSFIGIETDKFNDQIIKKINEKDKRLNLSLQRIKLTLDPLNLKLDAKTIGTIIYYDNKPIELEYIKRIELNISANKLEKIINKKYDNKVSEVKRE